MTKEELKKKIVDIIQGVDIFDSLQYRYCIEMSNAEKLADALIDAGIGDVETTRKIGAHATAMAVLQAAKAVLQAAKAEHRAEVAERETIILSKWLADKTRKNYPYQAWLEAAQKQAEKELAEGKEENNAKNQRE